MEISVQPSEDIIFQTKESREGLRNKYSEIEKASNEFIKGTNHPEGAFHGFRHFLNAAEAAKQLLKAAQGDEMNLPNDPTHFWESLTNFCKDNNIPIEVFDNQTLETVMELFGMTHDLGNAFAGVRETENGLEFVCLKGKDGNNQFQKTGAEERSIEMTEAVVKHYLKDQDISGEKQNAIIKLVQTLTSETSFCISDRKKPFAIFSRMVDQIGQALVDEDPDSYTTTQRLLLQEEYYDPRGFKGIVVKKYGNFVSTQLPALCGKDVIPKEILQIFGYKEIPPHLIYKDDDPRLKELKLHPLAIRSVVLSKIHPGKTNFLQEKGKGYRSMISGAVLEILADVHVREGKETKLFEKEFLQVLQHPEAFGLDTTKIVKNPDLVEISFDEESNSFKIIGLTEVKSNNELDLRGVKQLSDGGSIQSVRNFCEFLNSPDTTFGKLLEMKLYDLAEKKRAWKEGGGLGNFIEVSENPKIKLILPTIIGGGKNARLQLPKIDPKDVENFRIRREVDEKIRLGSIEVVMLPYTHRDIENIVKKIYPS